MKNHISFYPAYAIIVLLFISTTTLAQHDHGDHSGESMPEGYDGPIKLYSSALGEHNWVITTSDTLAQAYFNVRFG